jgi:hypothetical protein
MSRAELMAKMTPHGCQITGMGFGGEAGITGLDVAGALGMGRLTHPAYLFGLLKYCSDHNVLSRIDRIMRGHVAAIGKSSRWFLTDDQIAGLARLAIVENIHCPVCDRCHGSGEIAARPCDKCAGSGRIPMSARRRAEIAGIPWTTWRREWDGRAQQCYGVAHAWDVEIQAHLHQQFARDGEVTEIVTHEMTR